VRPRRERDARENVAEARAEAGRKGGTTPDDHPADADADAAAPELEEEFLTIRPPVARRPARMAPPEPPEPEGLSALTAGLRGRGHPLAFAGAALLVGLSVGVAYELNRSGVLRGAAPSAPAGANVAVASSSSEPAFKPGKPDPAKTPGHATSLVFRPEVAGLLGNAAPAVPEGVRREVFAAYGIPEGETKYVPCRLIPPSLNGDDSPANVFPVTPWFWNLKARLDKELTTKVAAGAMTVEQAQKELMTDWIAAAHRHYVRNYGENDGDKAKKTEENLRWSR
jgi:hypothetical protein